MKRFFMRFDLWVLALGIRACPPLRCFRSRCFLKMDHAGFSGTLAVILAGFFTSVLVVGIFGVGLDCLFDFGCL